MPDFGVSTLHPYLFSLEYDRWRQTMHDAEYKVLVLDMQPIAPPLGGGRIRLLGLYHDLGVELPTKYIGTYDWPGPTYRDHYLSTTLREIDIPLSDEHFAENRKWQARVGGKTIIDTAFHQLAHLSAHYVECNKKEVAQADIVIFSHPWVYPLVKKEIKPSQLIVYDSQNVEGYLRHTLLDDGDFGTKIVREGVRVEHELCHAADLVLTCSHEDRVLFHKLYQVPFAKMRVVPNGVFTKKIRPPNSDEKKMIKQQLGIGERKVAIFIGSNYPPNVEAANFILKNLAPRLPEFLFIIAGGVGDGIDKNGLDPLSNIRITGLLEEPDKLRYLSASDFAINPMFSGSGTNIKMFDFMAAGLPIFSTEIGARGIEEGARRVVTRCDENTFLEHIRSVMNDAQLVQELAASGRQLVEEKFSFEKISRDLGLLVSRFQGRRAGGKPFFSIVVPSYNRHDNLRALMKALSLQRCRDFEVIIVDQSDNRWLDAELDFGFDIFYIHTDIRGTAKARNTAAFYARGSVLAFTDDDCIPEPAWLDKAMMYFVEQKNVVGLEGYIKSDKINDPEYRPVTNEGFTGIGFMTANLFLKAEIFNRINGFDERFDTPFREDTDLAWRAQEYGEIPFRADVIVFHPPHPRKIERESLIARSKLFEKDALLLKKHPKKYMELFLLEKHWKNTAGFWENFLRGAIKYGIDPDDYDVNMYYPLLPAGTMILSLDGATPPGSTMAMMSDLSADIVDKMLSTRMNLSTEIPREILAKLPSASSITGQVKMIIGDKTHGSYFDTSVERYNQYFSIAAAFLPKGATILDIGNAPGHVGIGLHLMGMRVQGLNLNDCWHSTYPSLEWLKTFNIISHDFEKSELPYDDNLFDAIYFTEVLEHIAVKNPVDILTDFLRVLKPGGLFVMSTPNICNISNIYALFNGKNIFWPNDIFYGGFDRHNREYTPDEVSAVVTQAGFANITMYGFNCNSNWRKEGAEFAKRVIDKFGDKNPLFKNTIMVYARK